MSRSSTPEHFSEGDRIGDYIVEQQLGLEETGVVYLGRHAVLPRRAAVKVMHGGEAWSRQVAVRMLKEACLVEALSHPGVPRVYECGVLADRRPWTAFEYVDGDPIGTTIANGPMAVADAVVLIRDVADILEHLHHRGIVHRHLTPESIIRAPGRRFSVCIRDWSHASPLDADAAQRLDPRDDVYALGVIAFRALTGAHADSVAPSVERGVETTHDRYPGAPRDVAALIDSMLSRDLAWRPTSAEIRDRAKWLADTLEIVPTMDRPRWTPPHGLDDVVPTGIEDAAPGFAIRISRTPTRR